MNYLRAALMVLALLPSVSFLGAHPTDANHVVRGEMGERPGGAGRVETPMNREHTQQNARAFEHGAEAGNIHGQNQNQNQGGTTVIEQGDQLDDSTPTQSQE